MSTQYTRPTLEVLHHAALQQKAEEGMRVRMHRHREPVPVRGLRQHDVVEACGCAGTSEEGSVLEFHAHSLRYAAASREFRRLQIRRLKYGARLVGSAGARCTR